MTETSRLIQTTLLVLLGVLLAVATINDVVRQTHINHRLVADLATWRSYSGHDFKNVGVDEELLGVASGRDVACGNTTPGAPRERTQLCLVLEGPTRGGRREVAGGWYLPPLTHRDLRAYRYGCFGRAGTGMCAR
ncbi:MAG TPA: hypothetical protein VGD00_02385 [Solirubrobacteraceae bacterium]|jgi:hypothetical protein